INAPAPQTQAKQWWGLAVLVIPSTLLFMMLTILFLAAPKMAADLGPTSAQLLWILDIYGFVMAGFLVAMGVVGDRVGKRRLPVMALVAIGAPLLLPEHKDETARIDIFSALLLVAALLGIIYGIKRFATQEPVGPTAGLLIAGMLVGLWFMIRQLRSVNPLLDVRLFANRTVSGALTVCLLSAAALGGVYSLFTQYLQQVQGLSPMQAGLSIIPAAAVLIVVPTLS